ncbi:unnamed protein product [Auanema sp. JU1783]|nr:unnamed protein product [Auanema sp. JU1783]
MKVLIVLAVCLVLVYQTAFALPPPYYGHGWGYGRPPPYYYGHHRPYGHYGYGYNPVRSAIRGAVAGAIVGSVVG